MSLKDSIAAAQRATLMALAELCGWELSFRMQGMGHTQLVAEHPLFGTVVYE